MTILLSSLIYQNANIGWPLVAPTYLCKTCTTFFRLVIFRGGKYKIKFFKRIFEPTEKFAPCFIKKTRFWQRGAMDIASASGTEDPGSNHARV
jgi:hypothetical protein